MPSPSLNFHLPEDYMLNLLQEDFYTLGEDMIEAALPVLLNSIKSHLAGVIRNGTGELISNVVDCDPRRSRTNALIATVYVKGVSKNHYYGSTTHARQYEVSNALKAIWLNYGNAHQTERPWLQPAVKACMNEVYEIMQKKYEELTSG